MFAIRFVFRWVIKNQPATGAKQFPDCIHASRATDHVDLRPERGIDFAGGFVRKTGMFS
jgi:hypothetical protein